MHTPRRRRTRRIHNFAASWICIHLGNVIAACLEFSNLCHVHESRLSLEKYLVICFCIIICVKHVFYSLGWNIFNTCQTVKWWHKWMSNTLCGSYFSCSDVILPLCNIHVLTASLTPTEGNTDAGINVLVVVVPVVVAMILATVGLCVISLIYVLKKSMCLSC